MSRALLILVGIITGLFLDVLSNWLYEIFRQKGFLPDKPSFKRLLLVLLFFLPIILLVILPEIVTQDKPVLSSQELVDAGAFVEIQSINPSPDTTSFISSVETPVVVELRYHLPSNAISPEVHLEYLGLWEFAGWTRRTPELVRVHYATPPTSWGLQHLDPAKSQRAEYLTSHRPGDINWQVIHSTPAEVGTHHAQSAGTVIAPDPSALNDESFQIAVVLNILDEETGRNFKIASDSIAFALNSGE